MTLKHERRGDSQLVVVFGMVLMLVLGVVFDRLYLLQALPTTRITELLHLGTGQTQVNTPKWTPAQSQVPQSTASSSPVHFVPHYLGSQGARIPSSFEMTSGPTCSGSYIRGVIRNKSSKNIGYVSIDFAVYDASGNKLDPTSAFFGDLGPGETWRYEAIVIDNDAASFKLTAIEAY